MLCTQPVHQQVGPLNSNLLPTDCTCMRPKAQAARSTSNIDCEYESATAISNANCRDIHISARTALATSS